MRPEERFLAKLARRRVLLASEANKLLFRAPAGALDAELREQIRSYKENLVRALEPRSGFVQLAPPSYNQLSLFFLHLADPITAAYNLALVMRIRSSLDTWCMRTALERLARRHDQLRTTLDHIQLGDTTILCQYIAEDLMPVLEEFDMRGSSDSELREQAQTFYAAPFNLREGPTLRAGLFARAPNDQVLVVKLHHVVADGWSLGVIARDLGHYYRCACEGSAVEPEIAARGTYADFALDQLEFLSEPDGLAQMKFWQDAHTPVAKGLELGTAGRRPAIRRSVGATQYFEISAEELARLTTCAQSLNITIFALLLAAFQAFLLERSKQGDVCIGIPTLGRRGEAFNETVGYFVNPVALRSRRPEPLNFREHARRTAEEMTAALDHRDAPFAAVVESLEIQRDTSRTPVFQVLFNLLSRRMLGDVVDLIYPSPSELAIDFGGLAASSFDLNQQEGQFDLTLEFVDRGNGLFGLFKYCTDLFSADDARTMIAAFRDLLDKVASDPDSVLIEGAAEAAAITVRSEEKRLQLVLAATFTAEAMQEAFDYWFERLGWQNRVAFAPFNQIFQTLLDPGSLLRSNPDQPAVVLLRFDDLLGRSEQSTELGSPENIARLNTNLNELVEAVEQAARAASAPLLVVVCPSSPALQAAPDEGRLRESFVGQLQAIQGVHVLTQEMLAKWYPTEDFYEPLGEQLGHIPYTPAFLAALASGIVRTLNAVTSRPCKAIAIDCDNTLWDGVVGEEGVQGVVIGPHQRVFQEYLIEQFKAGVVLCLCSKNQEADVWSVFDQHPDMLLRREHIGFWRINWESKSENLKELAAEINIGVDSFVFFDDNPVERGEMKANCPSVLCAEFPQDWSLRVPYLRQLWALDHIRITEADRQRNEHYRSERLRKDLQSGAGNLGDFLSKLELEIDIHPALPAELERLAQLSIRTNQFNTTVRRMTLPEVEQYATGSGQLACSAHVRDRFGDYGLVGAAMASVQGGGVLQIDSLLLSCRALGRGVEHRIAAWLGEQARARDCGKVKFPVTPTERNEPARKFLAKVQQQCDGGFDPEGALWVDTARLIVLQCNLEESPATTSAAEEGKSAKAHKEAAPLWDSWVLDVAAELGTVDAITSAINEHRRHKRRPVRAEQRGSGPRVAPTSETERIIGDAWKRVLSLDDVGTRENFFEIGGTSVLSAQLAVDLSRHGIQVSIIDLLQYPTVAALAKHVSAEMLGAQSERLEVANEPPKLRQRGAPFERLKQFRRR